MSHDKDLTEGVPPNPTTPLYDEISSDVERIHTSLGTSRFPITRRSHIPRYILTAKSAVISWIQKSRLVFRGRSALSRVTKRTEEQSAPLLWEHLEPTSDVPITEEGPRFASLDSLGPFFPEADPAHPKAQTWRTWRSKRQTVLYGCSVFASLVLLANVGTTVYFKIKWRTTGGLGTIFRGDCSQSHRLNSNLHIIINVLSTTLLATSNLCMQLLAAPTRREIDQAHGNYVWLDIGVPSLRNLKHISKKRRVVILLLATTSIPLHFL